jgi:hypothetical protein
MDAILWLSLNASEEKEARAAWQAAGGRGEKGTGGNGPCLTIRGWNAKDEAIAARVFEALERDPGDVRVELVPTAEEMASAELRMVRASHGTTSASGAPPRTHCKACGLYPHRIRPDAGVRLKGALFKRYDLFTCGGLVASARLVEALSSLNGLVAVPVMTTKSTGSYFALGASTSLGRELGNVCGEPCKQCGMRSIDDRDSLYWSSPHRFARAAWDGSDFAAGCAPTPLFASRRAWEILSNPKWKISGGLTATPVILVDHGPVWHYGAPVLS